MANIKVVLRKETKKDGTSPLAIRITSSRTSTENSQPIKNTTRKGGDFFRLPKASEAQTVRRAQDADYLAVAKGQV